MSRKNIQDKNGLRFTALTAAILALCLNVRADGHGEKIEFSQPSTSLTAASNLTATVTPSLLNPAPSAFKQIQDDLFRPLANSMNPANSMQGVMSLPPPPQPERNNVATKRSRQLLEQRKNWAFADVNDLYPDPTVDGVLGQETELLSKGTNSNSLIERYFNRIGQSNGLTNHTGADANDPSSGAYPFSQNTELARPFAPDRETSRYIFGPQVKTNNDVAPGYKYNYQQAYSNPMTHDEMAAAKKRAEEFRQILEHSPASPPTSVLTGINSDPLTAHASALDKLGIPFHSQANGQRRSATDPFADPTIAALHNQTSDDPTAAALGQPNPQPQQPVVSPVDPSKVTQRMLDPFGSVVQKPRF